MSAAKQTSRRGAPSALKRSARNAKKPPMKRAAEQPMKRATKRAMQRDRGAIDPQEATAAKPKMTPAPERQSENCREDSLRVLTELLLHFRHERDWKQFHNPKDQALSLCLESAELLELMQWRNGAALDQHLAAHETRHRLGEELADVLGWVLLLAHDQHIDLPEAFRRKLRINQQKYPVEKARGSAKKYTEL